MDCLLCYKMFIGEKEFENYNQNPQFCKKAILELFRISRNPDVQGLSEDLVLCLCCHRKLEDVGDFLEQLEELQKKVDEAKVEIKQGLVESKKVSEVMAKDFGDSMSKSSLDRLVLLRAIETGNIQPPAPEHDGIDVGGPNESSEDQQPQDQAYEPENEIHDFENEQEGMLPIGATKLKEVKLCLERVQPPGLSTIKSQIKSNHVPTSSNGGHALRNPKPHAKNTTQIEESSNEESSSGSETGEDSSSEDDTGGQSKASTCSNVLGGVTKGGDNARRAPGSLLKEFTRLENGSFQCKNCSKSIRYLRNLGLHLLIHNPPRFKCSIQDCGKKFIQKGDLDKHVNAIHEKKRDFRCTWTGCGKSFSNSSGLHIHVKGVHKGKKDFKCTKAGCGKSFIHQYGLIKHVKTIHEGRKDFKCPWEGCGKWFGENTNLTKHVKAFHERSKDYKCGLEGCDKAFGSKSNLNQHRSAKHKKMAVEKKRMEEGEPSI